MNEINNTNGDIFGCYTL